MYFHVMGLKESFKMEAKEFQKWIAEYYKSRGWSDLDIFVRIGFLSEETGEVARAIRSLEIGRNRPDEHTASLAESKRNLTEELGDVLGNLVVIANKYNNKLEEINIQHKRIHKQRYQLKISRLNKVVRTMVIKNLAVFRASSARSDVISLENAEKRGKEFA